MKYLSSEDNVGHFVKHYMTDYTTLQTHCLCSGKKQLSTCRDQILQGHTKHLKAYLPKVTFPFSCLDPFTP